MSTDTDTTAAALQQALQALEHARDYISTDEPAPAVLGDVLAAIEALQQPAAASGVINHRPGEITLRVNAARAAAALQLADSNCPAVRAARDALRGVVPAAASDIVQRAAMAADVSDEQARRVLAAAGVLAATSGAGPQPDKGPLTVHERGQFGAEVWSDDFEHDAKLQIRGDMAPETKLQYARWLAGVLNSAAPAITSEQIESLILEHSEPDEDGSYCINRGDMRAFAADLLKLRYSDAAAPADTAAQRAPLCTNCMGQGWEPSVYDGRRPCGFCKPGAAAGEQQP